MCVWQRNDILFRHMYRSSLLSSGATDTAASFWRIAALLALLLLHCTFLYSSVRCSPPPCTASKYISRNKATSIISQYNRLEKIDGVNIVRPASRHILYNFN